METKYIITAIMDNRRIMQEQLGGLAAISPKPLKLDSTTSPHDLLGAALDSHLQGAADALRAIADVEMSMRKAMGRSEHQQENKENTVIDVAYKELS